jgi:hypothetical protein
MKNSVYRVCLIFKNFCCIFNILSNSEDSQLIQAKNSGYSVKTFNFLRGFGSFHFNSPPQKYKNYLYVSLKHH